MIYFLTPLCGFMFLALCGACHRIKQAEEHIEIIREALDRHLTDGSDYRSSAGTSDVAARANAMLAQVSNWQNRKP